MTNSSKLRICSLLIMFDNICMFRYWLYAAVRCKSLLVTNDEMRDHIFELLGNDFFPKWKERHQVCLFLTA